MYIYRNLRFGLKRARFTAFTLHLQHLPPDPPTPPPCIPTLQNKIPVWQQMLKIWRKGRETRRFQPKCKFLYIYINPLINNTESSVPRKHIIIHNS